MTAKHNILSLSFSFPLLLFNHDDISPIPPLRYATIFVAWWEVAMFFIFAFAYNSILTKPLNFCVW